MKFEHRYPQAKSTDRFEFEYSHVTKTPQLGQCRWCNSYTRWLDVLFQVHVCSEECGSVMWKQYREDKKKSSTYDNFESHFSHVKKELALAESENKWKDIIIVVRDQLDYFKACIDSIKATTKNYHLYIWDNGSGQETQDYISGLIAGYDPEQNEWAITSMRSDNNTGFIYPNNQLVSLGDSDYIILLNSDTKVFEGWDRVMTGFLESNPQVKQVGYWGGHMGADGRGFGGDHGYQVDYIPGWCFTISRETYDQYGLFNGVDLKFAYCEDADLSLRLKAAGHQIYSLHAPLVHHYQNKTIKAVEQEGEIDVRSNFEHNHEYIKTKWANYLANDRVLLKRKESQDERISVVSSTV